MSEVCFDCALLPTVVCSTYSTSIFFGLSGVGQISIGARQGFSQRTKELVKELAEELGARALGKPGAGIVVTQIGRTSP